MKKLAFVSIILLFSLAACTAVPPIAVTTLPSDEVSPSAVQSVIQSDTPSPAAAITVSPDVLPDESPSASVSASASPAPTRNKTVIIASSEGEIRGGFSKGKWLTQSKAAKLCKGKMTFNMYDLEGFKGTVESSGAAQEEEDEYPGETTPDTSGCFYLNLPEGVIDSNTSYLYSGGKLPDMETDPDIEDISISAVQTLLDETLGKGKAEANIHIAVIADIDGDGEKETVAEASDPGDDTTYDLLCVIESDGTAKEIYIADEEAGEQFSLQSIIDIDGDGISELVVDKSWGDDSATTVYKYDGKKVKVVLEYYALYPCP